MFKRKLRLSGERNFEKVYKKGFFGQSKYYKINLIQNRIENPRFSVVVSKKVEKSAVKRNRIKRVTREMIRNNLPLLNKSYDIIVGPKKEALQAETKTLNEDLYILLKKVKAIN